MKPTISIVVAMDEKQGIGKDNKIPWHIKKDLQHLKDLTFGQTIILGRKTYESMEEYYDKSGREMPGKLYIIVTHKSDYKPGREHTCVALSVEDALLQAEQKDAHEVFVIGGQQIFTEILPRTSKLYITQVKGDYNADAFFPEIDKAAWNEIEREDHEELSFITYQRADTLPQ